MKIKEQVSKMVGEGKELKSVDVSGMDLLISCCQQYSKLVLDSLKVIEVEDDDKAFLEGFSILDQLSMNGCFMKSLKNMPAAPKLARVRHLGFIGVAGAQRQLPPGF